MLCRTPRYVLLLCSCTLMHLHSLSSHSFTHFPSPPYPVLPHPLPTTHPTTRPINHRAVSELQDSNGLAFEMAESVLDLGSSPPSTPQLTHRKLLPPVGGGPGPLPMNNMNAMNSMGIMSGGMSENLLLAGGGSEGGHPGAGGSSSSTHPLTHPDTGPTDFLTQALNSLSSSDSIGSMVDESDGDAGVGTGVGIGADRLHQLTHDDNNHHHLSQHGHSHNHHHRHLLSSAAGGMDGGGISSSMEHIILSDVEGDER